MRVADVTDRFFAAIERGDIAGVEALYHDEGRTWYSFTEQFYSKADVVANLARMMAVASARYVVRERFISGASLAQRHDVLLRMNDGSEQEIPTAIFITQKDGQIFRIDEYVDSSRVLRDAVPDMQG